MAALSESESKVYLAGHGLQFPDERTATTAAEAAQAATQIGFPVVLKAGGPLLTHKSDRSLVILDLRDHDAVKSAADDLLGRLAPEDGPTHLVVARMVAGNRELILGLQNDAAFGTVVMLGVGGTLAELIDVATCRLAPVDHQTALNMIDDLSETGVLDPVRGEPEVDREALAGLLVALSHVRQSDPSVEEVDLNPVIISNGAPVPVDALVVFGDPTESSPRTVSARSGPADDQLRALLEPRGVIVAGVSSHPGKFGFAVLHHILACGYQGGLYAVGREAGDVLGVPVVATVDDLPAAPLDLLYICSPPSTIPGLMRAAARRGVRAVFVASGGFAEAGESGRRAEAELLTLADELGMVLVGPNGMGVISTPVKLCAQLHAPYPPAGRIGVVSQSGNFVMASMNYAIASGIGVSRAVSAGNAIAVGVDEYLEWFGRDDATSVALAYIEGVADGRRFLNSLNAATAKKPVVVVKGGVTAAGSRAAASHTGALATDERVFDGLCRQVGVTRATTVDEAFDAAATFATQPLPRGPRTVVLTLAGGWGVMAADAIARTDLVLSELPDDLRVAIDARVPPRWSRGNPIDLAGGETRDTVPEVLELAAAHPDVDAVIFVGFGIQSNTAQLIKSSPYYPNHGLDRIASYHERQDRKYAEAADVISRRYDKPVLCVTELAITSPGNCAPAGVRASGRLCYSSVNRAVTALAHAWNYRQHRTRQATGAPAAADPEPSPSD